jgi:hypothetical protein
MAPREQRKRVGRPKSGKEAVWFWIRTETAGLLRELFPSRERSAFVDDVIRRELEKTGTLESEKSPEHLDRLPRR